MKKQITLCLAGAALLIGTTAMASNPGITYYSNEQTKAEAYAHRMKYVAKEGKRHWKETKKHLHQTDRAYAQAMRQHQQYRRFLASEIRYANIASEFTNYPRHEYHTESVHATVVQTPRMYEVQD